jgi:hypothetical protein
MVAIVSGFNNNVIGNLQAFGANRIEFKKYEESFHSGDSDFEEQRKRHNLTMADAAAIRAAVPEALAGVGARGHTEAVLHVKHGNLEANMPYTLGVDDWYPRAPSYNVGHGRFFTSAEIAHSAPVAIVGADVKDAIFPLEDPVGKDITWMASTTASSASSRAKGSSSGGRRTTRSCSRTARSPAVPVRILKTA